MWAVGDFLFVFMDELFRKWVFVQNRGRFAKGFSYVDQTIRVKMETIGVIFVGMYDGLLDLRKWPLLALFLEVFIWQYCFFLRNVFGKMLFPMDFSKKSAIPAGFLAILASVAYVILRNTFCHRLIYHYQNKEYLWNLLSKEKGPLLGNIKDVYGSHVLSSQLWRCH